MEQRYSVTQTAQILGVRASVLRYWEDELNLQINRNEQGHRYYTGDDITLLANIKELKKRGLALRAIKEVIPKLSRMPSDSADCDIHTGCEINTNYEIELQKNAPWEWKEEETNRKKNNRENNQDNNKDNKTDKVRNKENRKKEDKRENEKILEFQKILERLITQELQMQKEGENDCRSLDAAIRSRQLARKEAAASLEKKNKKRRRKY